MEPLLPGRVRRQVAEFSRAATDGEASEDRLTLTELEGWMRHMGFSGDTYTFLNGSDDFVLDDSGSWCLAASRGGEVTLKHLDQAGRRAFADSDPKEWQGLKDSGVVRVLRRTGWSPAA